MEILKVQVTASDQELSALLDRFICSFVDCAVRPDTIAAIIGVPAEMLLSYSIGRPPARVVEERLRLFVDLVDCASLLLGSKREVGEWLEEPNPALVDRHSPAETLTIRPESLSPMLRLLRNECVAEGYFV